MTKSQSQDGVQANDTARASHTEGPGAPAVRDDAEWHRVLPAAAYRVLRQHATERPGTSPLNAEHRDGQFLCAGCGTTLFGSTTKYDSGSGWPSFYAPVDGSVATTVDSSLGMVRTEVHCARCGGHLGHIFPDGPQPTGLRYCINGAALKFEPEDR
ncbi:MAG: peptide-methionine (R)-S-oxide reductase MsrB [Azospirillaceae bacterium]|nr:peptide-methionine (R)-S-oxide reductase MsrB [Azospirillaceae bacterium]